MIDRSAALFKYGSRFLVLAIVALLIRNAGGEIEAVLFPIARDDRLTVLSDTGLTICYVHEFEKMRGATPVSFSWRIRSGTDYENWSNVTPFDPDTLQPMQSVNSLKAGHARLSRCISIPANLQGSKSIIIDADADYRSTWHSFWLVPRNIPAMVLRPSKVLPD